MGRIDADELPADFVEPDFLCPVQDGHRLAVGHPFQHPCLIGRLDEPEGQQRGQKVEELAPDDGVVVVDAGLVNASCRLVINRMRFACYSETGRTLCPRYRSL